MHASLKEFSQPYEYTIVQLPLFLTLHKIALSIHTFTLGLHTSQTYQTKTQELDKCLHLLLITQHD